MISVPSANSLVFVPPISLMGARRMEPTGSCWIGNEVNLAIRRAYLAGREGDAHLQAVAVTSRCLVIDVFIGRFSDADRAKFDEPRGFVAISLRFWFQAVGELKLIFLLGCAEQT